MYTKRRLMRATCAVTEPKNTYRYKQRFTGRHGRKVLAPEWGEEILWEGMSDEMQDGERYNT